MFTNIFRGCFSLGAHSKFEKVRLQCTYAGDNNPPEESDLQQLMKTLNGVDQETDSVNAYTTIIGKVETSDSKTKWNYMMKNLIIFDRMIRSFVNFACQDMKQDFQVQNYFKIVQQKCEFYYQYKQFFTQQNERQQNFKHMKINQMLQIIERSQKLQEFILNYEQYLTPESLQYELIQYVMSMILITIINLYQCQQMGIVTSIERLMDMKLEQLRLFEKIYNRFLLQINETIKFIEQFKFIDSYSVVDETEFYKKDSRVFDAIKDYQRMLEKQRQSEYNLIMGHDIVYMDQKLLFSDQIVIQKEDLNVINFLELSRLSAPKKISQRSPEVTQQMKLAIQQMIDHDQDQVERPDSLGKQSNVENIGSSAPNNVTPIKAIEFDKENDLEFDQTLFEAFKNQYSVLDSDDEIQIKLDSNRKQSKETNQELQRSIKESVVFLRQNSNSKSSLQHIERQNRSNSQKHKREIVLDTDWDQFGDFQQETFEQFSNIYSR